MDGSVTELKLSYNGFTQLGGTIPPFICDLKNITSLHLSASHLYGDFPRGLYNCSKLTHLDLSSNYFNGSIPSDIHHMANLQILNLEGNMLTGNLPDSIFALKNLKELHLSYNSLSGEIPEVTADFNLTVIDLSVNKFEGKIPKNICGKGYLVTLDVSNNNLSGELFESLSNCHGLVTLRVNSNMFLGRISANISFWKQIEEFSAKNNQLSGPIPGMIGSLYNLRILDLSRNQLSGRIPYRLKLRNELDVLDLSFNPGLNNDLYEYQGLSSSRFSYREIILIVSASVVAACLGVLSIYVLLVKLRSKKREQNKPTDVPTWKFIPFHVLSFQESNILSGMTEGNVVGQGGSGKVYRVMVDDTEGFVAVKKICSKRKVDQNLEKQFLAEVDILGKIRHLNIVKLLCCISSESSKLLVYEYMENRSLDWWLHGNNNGGSSVSLVWPMRLKIAIGAAQGLCYMHHDNSPPIIHRDVKSGNILLDAEFNAKVADFGLAKLVLTAGEANTASVVAGSFGYIAPEYAQTKRLNEKIDVYSFGVVLLELTTGKKANAGDEYTGLAQWAWRHMQEGNHIPDALDEDIRNSPDHHVEEMVEMFKLGIFCTAMLPSARPSMKEVLQFLQSFHLQN